ncbi:hypothetical protein ACQP2K_10580 [Microbispora siamensis]
MADEQQPRHDAEKREDWFPDLVRFQVITFLSCLPDGPRRVRAEAIPTGRWKRAGKLDPAEGKRETPAVAYSQSWQSKSAVISGVPWLTLSANWTSGGVKPRGRMSKRARIAGQSPKWAASSLMGSVVRPWTTVAAPHLFGGEYALGGVVPTMLIRVPLVKGSSNPLSGNGDTVSGNP